VVAHQAETLEAWWRRGYEVIDHLCRIGATVDIVAKHDDQLAAGQDGRVGNDLVLERAQFAIAAMDVADRIDDRSEQVDLDAPAPG
jgi:hypothetical protein